MIPKIEFLPSTAKPGIDVTMSLFGFSPGGQIKYQWPAINYSQLLVAGANGSLVGLMRVDVSREPGVYEVKATDLKTGQIAKTSFKVEAKTINLGGGNTQAGAVDGRFPVSTSSANTAILDAFKSSGYWSSLNADQQAKAQADPVAYLKGHPFLYGKYPAYFVDKGETIPATGGSGAWDWVKANWIVLLLIAIFISVAVAYFATGSKLKKKIKELTKA